MPQIAQVLSPARQLLKNGWALIRFFPLGIVNRVVAGFLEFLKESQEYKDVWTFDMDGKGDPDDGYIHRQGGLYDYKSFFHYRPHLADHLALRKVDYIRYREWLSQCFTLYYLSLWSIRKFVTELNEEIPDFGVLDRFISPRAVPQHVMRLLYYEKKIGNGIIAKPHTDYGFLTLHVAESCTGLCIGPNMLPYIPEEGKALIFPGKKAQAFTQNKLQALEHCVKKNGNTSQNRWSIVFFSHIDFVLPS